MAKADEGKKQPFPGNFVRLTSKNGAAEYPLYVRPENIHSFTYYDGRSEVSLRSGTNEPLYVYVKESPEEVERVLREYQQALEDYYRSQQQTILPPAA